MCKVQGPVVLGHIEIPTVVSKYSKCDECGHRSQFSVYIRQDGVQRCDKCEEWQELAVNDNCASSIFGSADYWDGDDSYI